MATKKDAPKSSSNLRPTSPDRNVKLETLRSFGTRNMTTYAMETNLDRAIPDLVDGLKPVQRRILWTASQHYGPKPVKTAKVVGNCIANYHPHGDQSIVGAIETMVHHPTPTLEGHGEWGSLIDSAAAMRYNLVRLSDYGHTMFDPQYIHKNVTAFIPNFDDSDIEPVTLPAQLPYILMTGAEGIGVGMVTNLPSFTPESLIEIMTRLLSGEKLQAVDFAKTLKYAHKWGGHVVNTKANRDAWMCMFTGTKARVLFAATLEVQRDDKSLTIDDWPPGLKPEKFVERVRAMKECLSISNVKGMKYEIRMRRDHNFVQFDTFVEKIQKVATIAQSFKIHVTHTTAVVDDGVTKWSTTPLAMSVPKLIIAWLKERLALEHRSLLHRVAREKAAIAYSELLIFAANNIDTIVYAVRKTEDPAAYMMKKLKLDAEQVKQILDLQLRKLAKLEERTIETKLKEQRKHLSILEGWQRKPKTKIKGDLERILDAVKSDRAHAHKLATQILTIA